MTRIHNDGLNNWSLCDNDTHTHQWWDDYVDELNCHACGIWVGWSSDGEFRDFWLNLADEVTRLCEVCMDDHNAYMDKIQAHIEQTPTGRA